MPHAGYKKTKCRGILRPEDVYTKEGLLRAAGIGPELLLEAKQSGMVTAIRCGVRVYFCGDEVIRWIKSKRSQ